MLQKQGYQLNILVANFSPVIQHSLGVYSDK